MECVNAANINNREFDFIRRSATVQYFLLLWYETLLESKEQTHVKIMLDVISVKIGSHMHTSFIYYF
jgi:hypothetical protein